MALVVKNRPANAGDIRDSGSVPELGRSPGGGHSNPLPQQPTLDWRIPWTEKPGGLQSIGSQRVGYDWATKHSTAAAYIHQWGKLRLREVNLSNIIYLIASETRLGLEQSPLSSNTNLVFWQQKIRIRNCSNLTCQLFLYIKSTSGIIL